jgi:ribonuclease BN (tRNA processing enzyme)
MKITFLGTNGWYSTRTGSTICALLESEKYYVVFDAGEGIYNLERHVKGNKPIFLLLSHLHLDHIFGLHVFPKFKFKNKLRVFCPKSIRNDLLKIAGHPYMMPLGEMNPKKKLEALSSDGRELPFTVEYKKLLHVDPSFGYRLELEGKIITYCSDTGPSENSIFLARGTDILIHECAAGPGVISGKWGHSNPEEAAEVAKKAGAKKLILTHFSASTYKRMEDRLEAQKVARKIFKNTFAAKDGMVVSL